MRAQSQRPGAAIWLAKADIAQPHIIEAVLGHAPVKGIAAVYNVHKYAEECRRAREAWSAHVTGAEPAVSNVTPLRRAEGA